MEEPDIFVTEARTRNNETMGFGDGSSGSKSQLLLNSSVTWASHFNSLSLIFLVATWK